MMSKRCSNVVESRVEHAIRSRKPQECSFYFGFGTAPARLPFGDAPTSDNDSPRRVGLPIDELGDLSIDRDQLEQVKPGHLSNCRRAKRRSVIIAVVTL